MLRSLFGGRASPEPQQTSKSVIPTGVEAFAIGPDGNFASLRMKTTSSGSGWIPSRPSGRARELTASDAGRTLAYSASVWAFRCANIRAKKVAEQLQNAKLYDKNSNQLVTDHPYFDALNYAFEQYHQEFYFNLAVESYIYGESYVEKMPMVADLGLGRPVVIGAGGVRVLPSLMVEPYIPYGEIEGYDFLTEDGRLIRYAPDEIAYLKTYNPADTLRGMSIMDVAMESVNVDMYVVRFAKKYYENGARPGIVFTPKELDLTSDDLDSIKDALKREVKGVDNWHKPLFLTRALEATLYPSPEMEDQGYLTDESRERIAAAFSVPVGLITFGNARYQFSPELRKSFYEETVIPDVNAMVRWINTRILPYFDQEGNYELRSDQGAIIALLEDQFKRTEMYNEMFDRGAISFNERRVALNMTPIENGDFYSLPAGRIFVSDEQMITLIGQTGQPNMLDGLSHGTGTPSFTFNSAGQEQEEEKEPPPSSTKADQSHAKARQTPPQTDVLDELRAWEKRTLNSGPRKAAEFVCYHLPEDVQTSVRAELEQLGDEASQAEIRALFERLRQDDRLKAIQATRIEFELELESLLLSARADEGGIERRRFAQRLRTAIRKFGEQAYRDGLEDGGVYVAEDEPLQGDDLAEVNRLNAEQSTYVTNFGATLFDKKAISDVAAMRKPAMWYNKSIHPFYLAGLASADRNGMYEWILGNTEDHCSDCLRLMGQRHRLRDWQRKGWIPKAEKLECNGFECDCKLQKTPGRAQGSF